MTKHLNLHNVIKKDVIIYCLGVVDVTSKTNEGSTRIYYLINRQLKVTKLRDSNNYHSN